MAEIDGKNIVETLRRVSSYQGENRSPLHRVYENMRKINTGDNRVFGLMTRGRRLGREKPDWK